ncbi:MAG: hypothetical protein PUF51_07655 [Bifidobacteriaceae bacterium]|nr:hypothetical protein [Bifidobacteriaceae bacterium]
MSNAKLPPYGKRLAVFMSDTPAPSSWLDLDARDEFAWAEVNGCHTLVWRATGSPVVFPGDFLSYQLPMSSMIAPSDSRFCSAEPLTVAEHYRYVLNEGDFDKTFIKMEPPGEM